MNLEDLIKKYNLTFVNGDRVYIIDLKTNDFLFENTTPFYFKYDNDEIYCSSWKNLLPKVFSILNNKFPKTEATLLEIKNDWGKQDVFSKIKLSNYVSVTPNIYMNCNHTSLHSFKTLQLLLNEYKINFEECVFVIKRQPCAEPKEVKEFYLNETKNKFKFYLKYVKNLSDSSVEIVLKNIDIINKNHLQKLSKGYSDFYLIQNPQIFLNYMYKIVEDINKTIKYPQNAKSAIIRQLNFLYDFVRVDRLKRANDMPSFLIDIENLKNKTNPSIDEELIKYLDIDDLL